MRRLVVASHGHFAGGLAHTLKLIAGQSTEVYPLNAYDTNTPIGDEVNTLLSRFDAHDEIVVLTDLLGGSVNQEFARVAKHRPGMVVISGANVPLAVGIAMLPTDSPLDGETIRGCIAEAKEGIVYVNDVQTSLGADDE